MTFRPPTIGTGLLLISMTVGMSIGTLSTAYAQNTTTFSCNPFLRPLHLASHGLDVANLQYTLSLDKTLYPEGIVSGYYGALTQRAVVRLQRTYSTAAPSTVYGVADMFTLNILNSLCVRNIQYASSASPLSGMVTYVVSTTSKIVIATTTPIVIQEVLNNSPPQPRSLIYDTSMVLIANPSTVKSGASSTLTWITQNMTYCHLDDMYNGILAIGISATTSTGTLATTSQFTLYCVPRSGGPYATTSATIRIRP